MRFYIRRFSVEFSSAKLGPSYSENRRVLQCYVMVRMCYVMLRTVAVTDKC